MFNGDSNTDETLDEGWGASIIVIPTHWSTFFIFIFMVTEKLLCVLSPLFAEVPLYTSLYFGLLTFEISLNLLPHYIGERLSVVSIISSSLDVLPSKFKVLSKSSFLKTILWLNYASSSYTDSFCFITEFFSFRYDFWIFIESILAFWSCIDFLLMLKLLFLVLATICCF